MIELLIRDLARSKSKIASMFLSNLVLTALNVVMIYLLNFLYTMENAFSSNLNAVYFNYTIISGTFTFMIFIIVVVFFIAMMSNVVFILFYIEKRTRDIGIMKAAGASQSYIVQFFLFAPIVVCLGSFFIASLVTSILMTTIWPNLFPNTMTSVEYILFLLLGNVVSVIMTPVYKIEKLFDKKVSENLNMDYNKDYFDLRKTSRFRNLLKRLGRTLFFSYKNLLTRKNDFSRSMLILTCACLATGLLLTSAFVIEGTYSNNIKASLGGNVSSRVVMVGHKAMVDYITSNYRSFYEPGTNLPYLPTMHSNEFSMNRSAFNASRFEGKIERMDWRIIYETIAREVQGIEPTPPIGYRVWGKDRSCKVVVHGVELDSLFNADGGLSQQSFGNDGYDVILGDTVAGLIIDNMDFQKIDLDGGNHKIAGKVFETFNNGFIIYMNQSNVWMLLNKTAFYNCVFLVLKPASDNEMAACIADLNDYVKSLYGDNFTARSLRPIFSSVIDSPRHIWWLYGSIASLIFVFSLVFQQEFINMAIQSNSRDYKVMHALGMEKKRIARVIHEEFTIVLSLACILSFGLSLIVSSLFIIPLPSLPPIYVPIAIFGAIWLCFYISSLFITTRGRRLRFLIGSQP
ncbi:MAG: FtsX-like permease family protein [Candidatus Sigynarchaeota archaeon]